MIKFLFYTSETWTAVMSNNRSLVQHYTTKYWKHKVNLIKILLEFCTQVFENLFAFFNRTTNFFHPHSFCVNLYVNNPCWQKTVSPSKEIINHWCACMLQTDTNKPIRMEPLGAVMQNSYSCVWTAECCFEKNNKPITAAWYVLNHIFSPSIGACSRLLQSWSGSSGWVFAA